MRKDELGATDTTMAPDTITITTTTTTTTITTITVTTMAGTGTDGALYRLMTWLSPAYPVGAFSYSHGIEYAVEAGLMTSEAELTQWIDTVLRHGAGAIDAALLAATWQEAVDGDDAAIDAVAELAAAWRGSAELALESMAQGRAFLSATRNAWPHPALDRFALRHQGEAALPVAVGLAAAAHGVPRDAALVAYLQGFAANLVSAGIRLIPLGQSAGQRAIAALEALVAAVAASAPAQSLDELGGAALMVDWSSMRHETQYTRLFRS
jgi:urease accessory protein